MQDLAGVDATPNRLEDARRKMIEGDTDSGVSIYSSILIEDPAHFVATYELASILYNCGEIGRSIGLLKTYASHRPSDPRAHSILGEVYRKSGDHQRAIGSCKTSLRLFPAQPDCLNTLGLCIKQSGDVKGAIEHFRLALELDRDYLPARTNLGLSLQSAGDLEEAVKHLSRVVELDQANPIARTNLGLAMLDQGLAAEALVHFVEAVKLDQNDPILHHNVGNALRVLGRPSEARLAYLECIRIDTEFQISHMHISETLISERRFREALVWSELAIRLDPGDASAWKRNAWLNQKCEDNQRTIESWAKAVELEPDNAASRLNFGWSLQEGGQLERAMGAYREAERLSPTWAVVHDNIGLLHEERGEMEMAEQSYRTALTHQPGYPISHARLATLLRGKLPDRDLLAIEDIFADPFISNDHIARLLFAIAHVYDGRKDYAKASSLLRRANAMAAEAFSQAGEAYSAEEHDRFIDRIIAKFGGESFGAAEGSGSDSRLPVFVFGLPRSGTTLVEQILASHGHVFGAGELRTARWIFDKHDVLSANFPDLAKSGCLPKTYLGQLELLGQGVVKRVVDKMPENYLYLGMLSAIFPNATYIHCRRDLRDVALSCWMTDFRSLRWTNDTNHIATRIHRYLELMEHWRRCLPVPMTEVLYEDLVENTEVVARRILEACGLDWDTKCLEFHKNTRAVRTASVTQVRKPIYRGSVGRWRNYEMDLGEMFDSIVPHSATRELLPTAAPGQS